MTTSKASKTSIASHRPLSLVWFRRTGLAMAAIVGATACGGTKPLDGPRDADIAESFPASDLRPSDLRPFVPDASVPSAPDLRPPGPADAAVTGPADAAPPDTAGQLLIPAREAVRRLIVVLWNQPTDATLIAEADAGKIATPEDVRQLALRMLLDPRARAGIGKFFSWWLEQDALLSPADPVIAALPISPSLRMAMLEESQRFGAVITLDAKGTYADLYTATMAVLNEPLAAIYGITGVKGDEFRPVVLPPGQRAGILTFPGVLARTSLPDRTSPTKRGAFVFRRLLCLDVPPPPANLPSTFPPAAPPNLTVRQRLASVVAQPPCQSCHQISDPPGLALEGFDALGHARTLDNGQPIDTRADLVGDLAGVASGAADLGAKLSRTTSATACFAKQWLSFALARPTTSAEAPHVASLAEQFAQEGFNIQELIGLVMKSDLFLGPVSLR